MEDQEEDTSPDELLRSLRDLRERLGHDPDLLAHVNTTLDALEATQPADEGRGPGGQSETPDSSPDTDQ